MAQSEQSRDLSQQDMACLQRFAYSLCSTSTDAIIICNDDGIITALNNAALDLFDYQADELLGQAVTMVLVDLELCDKSHFAQTIIGKHRNDSKFPLELTLSQFTHNQTTHYFCLMHNLTPSSIGIRKLSARQQQILRLVVDGNTSREIAEMLTISVKTVETHRAHIMDKLKARNVTELVRVALENHLV